MTEEELKRVAESLSMGLAHFDLQEFDTELDFSNKIGSVTYNTLPCTMCDYIFITSSPNFLREERHSQPFLVVVQCDSGHLNCDLIACARYRVCDEAIKMKAKNTIRGRNDVTHVLFVIRLPQQEVKSQFVGFQGDPWISVHIDDLRLTSETTVIPEQALNTKISELFIGEFEELDLVSEDDSDMDTENGLSPTEDVTSMQLYSSINNSVPLPVEEDMQIEESTAPISNEDPQLVVAESSTSIPRTTPISAMLPSTAYIEGEGGADMEVEGPETKMKRVRKKKSFIAQHGRLLDCVQAAVSKLSDSEQGNRSMLRIQKLMKLIPRTTTDQLGKVEYNCCTNSGYTFIGIKVKLDSHLRSHLSVFSREL